MPPPFLITAALAFWGWHTGLWWVALPLAVVAELPRVTRFRFALAPKERQRVADLCTLLIVLAAVWLGLREPRLGAALILLIQWLPVLVFPLLAVQLYDDARGEGNGLELSVLFLSLRGDGKPAGRERVDLRWGFLILCVISASMVPPETASFLPSLALLAGYALWPVATAAGSRGAPAARLGALGIAALLALGIAAGSRLAHDEAELMVMRLVEYWLGAGEDPYRATTAIGDVGRLKGSERIRLRVVPEPTAADAAADDDGIPPLPADPLLLATASYDRYIDGTWFTRAALFEPLRRGPDGRLTAVDADADVDASAAGAAASRGDAPPGAGLRLLLTLDRPEGLLPLPAGTVRIDGPARAELRRSTLGAVRFQFRSAPVIAGYRIKTGPGAPPAAAPEATDVRVPPPEQAALAAFIDQHQLAGLPPAAMAARLAAIFARDFRYTTDLPATPAGRSPIDYFLNDARRGHCEYFATAATLVLRAAGVPARYVRGWSVQEWSPIEGAWISRDRHAHAWVQVWSNGAWRDFDPTPPDWGALESAARPWHGQIGDLIARLRFVLSGAGGEERANRDWLLLPLAGLVALLGWRVARRGQRRRAARRDQPPAAPLPGTPFSALERSLGRRGLGRRTGETLRDWAVRLRDGGEPIGPLLAAAVALHYRDRFDPAGLAAAERPELGRLVARIEQTAGRR